jgi:hypothetical protein
MSEPKILDLMKMKKYAILHYDISNNYDLIINSGYNGIKFPFNKVITNDSSIFTYNDNGIVFNYPDNEVHHLAINVTLTANLRNTDDRYDMIMYLEKNNDSAIDNDELNDYRLESAASLNKQYGQVQLSLYNPYYAIKNGDNIGLYFGGNLGSSTPQHIYIQTTAMTAQNKPAINTRLVARMID